MTCGETKYQLQTIDFFVLRHTNHCEQQQQQQCQQKKLSFWYWTHVSKSIWDNKIKHRCHSSCYSFTALAWLSCEKKTHTRQFFSRFCPYIRAYLFSAVILYTDSLILCYIGSFGDMTIFAAFDHRAYFMFDFFYVHHFLCLDLLGSFLWCSRVDNFFHNL